ncbi:MAG: 30S ribosomal protein S20 [archaeon]|nr:30S ribosomal protein S20 [archaeon]
MANIKSAKKRCRVIKTKTEQNKIIKTGVKTAIKKVVVATQSGDKENAKALLNEASKAIDMAASKNILHVNNAARKKSRLATLVNKMA